MVGPKQIVIAAIASAFAFGPACSNSELPRYGEVLVIIDTDVPVPRWVNRLRIDLYSPDGKTWNDSRDTPRRDVADWPASFSLYTEDFSRDHTALLRVRAYPEGRVRDYRGERFTPREIVTQARDDAWPAPAMCDVPKDCELPRLIHDNVDVTPTTEPIPTVTIDRLVRIRIRPTIAGSIRITLHGICFGTMVDLASGQTCVDRDSESVAAAELPLSPDMKIPAPLDKNFGTKIDCPANNSPRAAHTSNGVKLFDEEVCVEGGTYIFGNPNIMELGPGGGVPERFATVSPFYLDKYEVTVARWRDAIKRGFKPPKPPISNPLALSRDTCNAPRAYSNAWCTYSDTPNVPENRETYPLSCVTWDSARAFCQFEGGDLPTEAQWEWAAQGAARSKKTRWPWGDADPVCDSTETPYDRMIFKRLWECSGSWYHVGKCIPSPSQPNVCGPGDGFRKNCGNPAVNNPRQGPQPEDAADHANGDRTQLGIVNLGGGVQEYMLDSLLSLASQCWAAAKQIDPLCFDPVEPQHTLRSDSWAGIGYGPDARRALQTMMKESDLPEVGFRCARSLEKP